MNVVSSFAVMLQEFAVVMTANTLANFSTLVSGWMFAPRRNVTSMIVAAGMAGVKHHSSFHRVFAAARWSLDAFGLAVFRMIEPRLDEEAAVMLAVDDTLVRKRGLKVFGAGASLSEQEAGQAMAAQVSHAARVGRRVAECLVQPPTKQAFSRRGRQRLRRRERGDRTCRRTAI